MRVSEVLDIDQILGTTVQDVVTGFKGVVTGYATYMSGCNQALVVPKVKADGSWSDSYWIDIQRLEVQEDIAQVELKNDETPGADKAPPTQ